MVHVELTGGAVGIRSFRRDDVLALYEAVRESVPELTRWMVWCSRDYAVKDAVAFISSCEEKWKKCDQYSFVIFSIQDGALLGSISLNQVNRIHNYANVGYWVRSSCTRRGVATAAAELAAKFGIQELALSRLELLVPVENESSRRVAEKIGARNEGILRKRLLLQGQQHDAYMYSVVAENLRKPVLYEAELATATV
jgi:RimJ/RimL family protein N-acetyltransferase